MIHLVCAHVSTVYDTVLSVIAFTLGLPAATIRYVLSLPARFGKVGAVPNVLL